MLKRHLILLVSIVAFTLMGCDENLRYDHFRVTIKSSTSGSGREKDVATIHTVLNAVATRFKLDLEQPASTTPQADIFCRYWRYTFNGNWPLSLEAGREADHCFITLKHFRTKSISGDTFQQVRAALLEELQTKFDGRFTIDDANPSPASVKSR